MSSLHLKVVEYVVGEMVKAGDWWRGRSGGWFELIQLCQNRGKTLLSVPVVAIWPRHIPKFMFSMFSIFTPSAEIILGLILESCLNSAVMISAFHMDPVASGRELYRSSIFQGCLITCQTMHDKNIPMIKDFWLVL